MKPANSFCRFLAVFFAVAVALTGASFTKVSLDRGVPLLYEEDRYSELSVLQLAIKGGKRGEKGLPGLAWTTFKMALEPQSGNALSEMIELGAGLSTRVYGDYTLITLRVLSENLPKALDLISKSLMDPLFNSVRLDAVSTTRQHTRSFVMDSPDAMAYFAQLNAFFPKDPYHHNEYGEEEGGQKIRVADVKNHYRDHFVAGNVVFAVSTDLSLERISSLLDRMIEKIPQGKGRDSSSISVDSAGAAPLRLKKDRIQSLISSAWLIPIEKESDRMSGILLKTLLADGVGSRLWALRSKKNLIYSLSSEMLTLTDYDLLLITVRCEQTKRVEVEKELNGLLFHLTRDGIDEHEFKQTRAMARTTFFRNSENKEERCFWAIQGEVYGRPCDFLDGFDSLGDQIDLENFNRFLKKILGEGKRSVAVVGPLT